MYKRQVEVKDFILFSPTRDCHIDFCPDFAALTFPAPGEEAEGEVVTSVVTLDSKVSIVGKTPRRPRHGKKKTKRKSKKEAGR